MKLPDWEDRAGIAESSIIIENGVAKMMRFEIPKVVWLMGTLGWLTRGC